MFFLFALHHKKTNMISVAKNKALASKPYWHKVITFKISPATTKTHHNLNKSVYPVPEQPVQKYEFKNCFTTRRKASLNISIDLPHLVDRNGRRIATIERKKDTQSSVLNHSSMTNVTTTNFNSQGIICYDIDNSIVPSFFFVF